MAVQRVAAAIVTAGSAGSVCPSGVDVLEGHADLAGTGDERGPQACGLLRHVRYAAHVR